MVFVLDQQQQMIKQNMRVINSDSDIFTITELDEKNQTFLNNKKRYSNYSRVRTQNTSINVEISPSLNQSFAIRSNFKTIKDYNTLQSTKMNIAERETLELRVRQMKLPQITLPFNKQSFENSVEKIQYKKKSKKKIQQLKQTLIRSNQLIISSKFMEQSTGNANCTFSQLEKMSIKNIFEHSIIINSMSSTKPNKPINKIQHKVIRLNRYLRQPQSVQIQLAGRKSPYNH